MSSLCRLDITSSTQALAYRNACELAGITELVVRSGPR